MRMMKLKTTTAAADDDDDDDDNYVLVLLNMALYQSTRIDVNALGAMPLNRIDGRKQPFLLKFTYNFCPNVFTKVNCVFFDLLVPAMKIETYEKTKIFIKVTQIMSIYVTNTAFAMK